MSIIYSLILRSERKTVSAVMAGNVLRPTSQMHKKTNWKGLKIHLGQSHKSFISK